MILRNLFCGLCCILNVSGILAQGPAGRLGESPPMGWNSFDAYGVYCHEKVAFDNLKAMRDRLKLYGYLYFVIDNGWFGEYKLEPNTLFSVERHASDVHINEYGLFEPSNTYFPNGFGALIDSCHAYGLKFGLHLMRGIPRKAVKLNTPIEGTRYRATDIADTVQVCTWCSYNYGVNMDKKGAQEYYNSLIQHLADWGVDFIKYDDIVPYPQEARAVIRAVKNCRRPIVLSLSPGDRVEMEDLPILQGADMLRVTADIWDTQAGIDLAFNAWRHWQGQTANGCWMDMDMIPFGELQLMSPPRHNGGPMRDCALAGRGTTRQSELSRDQMYTFITQRALAASPLFLGGSMVTLDTFSFGLLTNSDMLACNQYGVMGKLVHEQEGWEVWKVVERNGDSGWIGVFNRKGHPLNLSLKPEDLGLESGRKYFLWNVWNAREMVRLDEEVGVPAHGVLFVRYEGIK